MTVGDIERVYVRGRVDEADIGRVRVGQAARIVTETFRDKTFQGRVTQISPIGVERDNVTTFEVEVSIDNASKTMLKANMTANAEIVLEEFAGSLLLPTSAVIYDAQRASFVDLVDPAAPDGRRRVPVKVGAGNGARIEHPRGRLRWRQGHSSRLSRGHERGPEPGLVEPGALNKLRSFLTMFGILGCHLGRRAVGHRRGLSAGQSARTRSSAGTSASSGAAARPCRLEASAPAARSGSPWRTRAGSRASRR